MKPVSLATKDHDPDIFDLENYTLINHPTLFGVTRYLSDGSKAYDILYKQWVLDGKPSLE